MEIFVLSLLQLIYLIAAFLLSLICTAWVGHYAFKHQIIDIPNHRSSHLQPTLRGGGVSIIIVFLAFALFAGEGLSNQIMFAIFAGGLIVALIGWLDDYKHLSPFIRLGFHLFAFLLSLFLLGIWSTGINWFGYLFIALVLTGCLNFFNFMDGIDGIAAVQAATMALSAAILLMANDSISPFIFYMLLLFAATIGFLVWNWSPAKIFMGDATSGFLGFILGLFAVATSIDGAMNFWCWIILFGFFAADATVTLAMRALKKEALYKAHRQHAYQRLAMNLQFIERILLTPEAARVMAHRVVTLFFAAVNLFWLLPLAWAALLMPEWGAIWTAIALLPLVLIVFNARHIGGSQGMQWYC